MMERVGKYITNYIKGKTPKVLLPNEEAETMPYLSPDYLRGVASPELYAMRDTKSIVVDDGEVIVLWDGSNAGEILISKKGVLASTMTMLQFDETQIDKAYFGYSFQNLEYILKAKTAGSGIPHADKGVINKLEFYKPSLSEQTAIAAILSKVDEAIAAVQASIAAAERLKKSLMQNLLTGRMKPDGTLRKEDEFYLDEKFGKVPVGWVVKKLGQLFSIKAGGDLQEEHYSPIKDATHTYPVFSNSLDNNGLYGYTSNPRFHAKESITITGRGGVGHPEYRQGDYDAIIRLISLIPLQLDTVDCKFVCYYIGRYVHFALESTGVPQLTCPKVFSTKIMIPIDLKEQCKIGEVIHHFDASIKEKQNKIAVLERLKKSLMHNLLTRKVRINNLI